MAARQAVVCTVLCAVGVALLAGCGSSSHATSSGTDGAANASTTAPQQKAAPPADVSAMLLGVGDLPTGWAVDNTARSDIFCYQTPLKSASPVADAHIDFTRASSIDEIGQEVAAFSSGPAAFGLVVKYLDACHAFTGTTSGQKASGTMGQMSFPKYGDESAAYLVNLSVAGLSASEELVVIRKANTLTALAYGGIGSVAPSQLEQLVPVALAKIPVGSPRK